MKPHRDDYARAFAERYSADAGESIVLLLVATIIIQVVLAVTWSATERAFPCTPGQIYAEPGRVYDCTPQGAWRMRGAR